VALLTTVNEAFDRVAMHGVRRLVAEEQAREAHLPLWIVRLPWPCSNDEYAARMGEAVGRARSEGMTHVAFGDLFLEEIRSYRESMLAGTGLSPLFPLWIPRERTLALAHEMIEGGLRAKIACVDLAALDRSYVGREFDEEFLRDLPPNVDPCGENGEFHTLCYGGPQYDRPIALRPGGIVVRDRFAYADFLVASPPPRAPDVAARAGP
jgi:diphthamide synthase (EF-2-diphthine--ammonia ligase)